MKIKEVKQLLEGRRWTDIKLVWTYGGWVAIHKITTTSFLSMNVNHRKDRLSKSLGHWDTPRAIRSGYDITISIIKGSHSIKILFKDNLGNKLKALENILDLADSFK